MFKKILSSGIILSFFLTSLGPLPQAHADASLDLPQPGTMVDLSPAYEPVMIKGLTIHKDNPFLFDFIVDVGQDRVSGEPLKKEGEKLIKYFLASLAIPDKDVWVNLSPYEKNKMIPEALGQTDMGRDLLEQDYILKQITASLIYPEKQIGKDFWDRVYAKARAMYGTTQVPVNTFNKVWIMADRAEVLERGQTAFVVDSHLKVMLEEDYLALQKHQTLLATSQDTHSIGASIVREIVLPELEKEVNTGKNFANLRQIFHSIILSSWYKDNLKQALLNQVYANQSKVKGIDLNDPTIKEQIYEQYLKAYKKGVFNYIKEDVNTKSGETIPRKYFSGGILEAAGAAAHPRTRLLTSVNASQLDKILDNPDVDIEAFVSTNAAMMNSLVTIANLLRGKRFSGLDVTRGSRRRVKYLDGTVDQFVAATDDARPGVRKRARTYIKEMRKPMLAKPSQLFNYISETIQAKREDWMGNFHPKVFTEGDLKDLYREQLGDTKIEDIVWRVFPQAWKIYEDTGKLPRIKYTGLKYRARRKESVEVFPQSNASMTAVTVNHENGTWDIVIGDKRVQSPDINDLAKRLEEILLVNIKVAGEELEITAASRPEPYRVNALDVVQLKETIELIAQNAGVITPSANAPAARQPIAITGESFPILFPPIQTSGNTAEASLKVRLTSKYGLATGGDTFKSLVMGAGEGKTDLELARQIISSGQIDPKKDWAKDQWYALKLFVAMRFILYQEYNTSTEQYIPNGPVESVIIDYLGADSEHKNIALSAQRIAAAYQRDQAFAQRNIDWSAFQSSFESLLQAAESLYDGLKDAYGEAIVEHDKELAVIQNAAKTANGHAAANTNGANHAIDHLPDVLAVITDARKVALTGAVDAHLTDVPAGTPNEEAINASNKQYQLDVLNHLRGIFNLGAAVPQERAAWIWAALNGQLPMTQWKAFEAEILPNPSNPVAPDKDRQERIITFMTIYVLLRQPLDSEGKRRAVLTMDPTFVAHVKGLFNPHSHITEEAFRSANSLLRLDNFFQKVPQGANQEADYWWKQYNSAVVNSFEAQTNGSVLKPAPQEPPKTPAVTPTAHTGGVVNGKFIAEPHRDFRANLEVLSFYAKGPFYQLSPDLIKIIWPSVIEPEDAKAVQDWKKDVEPKLPAVKAAYYKAAFAVVRALYHFDEEKRSIKVDDRMEYKVIRFIQLFVQNPVANEGRLQENIPGLSAPALSFLTQLNAAMVDKAASALPPGGIDLNTSKGMHWKISKDGRGVEMNVDAAMIERVRREGISSLSAVIFKITPIESIWPLVGLQAPVKA